ncbi:hypothetical protein TNCV_2895241 [Trichonephila clavipes]|nr:hypothetical protein TNCV_2895241 [Trichonephila clavipes]
MEKSKIYEWHRHFKEDQESIEYNERIGRLPLHGTWKMLRWMCLNMLEKIVAKHLCKSLRLHTFRRRRLSESIRCKRPQFW